MSVIMGFFGWRNAIALKVSGLIHNGRTFLLHPHPPTPNRPAHTHTHTLSLRKSRYMSDSWSGTNRDWARSLTSLTDILSPPPPPPPPLILSWDPYQFLTCIWPRTDDAKPFIPLQQVGKEAGRTKGAGRYFALERLLHTKKPSDARVCATLLTSNQLEWIPHARSSKFF